MPPEDSFYYAANKMLFRLTNDGNNFLKRESRVYQVDRIKDIFQNGPATILVTIGGNKTVVKSGSERFDQQLGLCMVLLRYLYDPKTYSQLVERVFNYSDEVMMQIGAAEMAIVAKIGEDDYLDILNTFVEKEQKKGNKTCK